MKEVTTYFYACLQGKNGKVSKTRFTNRDDARDYISRNFDPNIHESCWTE